MSTGRRVRLVRVKLPKLADVDAFNVAADAAFGEGQRHPRFKAMNDPRRNGGVFRQEIVQSVRPSQHQRLEPRGTLAEFLAQAARIDEQSLTQIAVESRLALRLCQHSQALEVVAFD